MVESGSVDLVGCIEFLWGFNWSQAVAGEIKLFNVCVWHDLAKSIRAEKELRAARVSSRVLVDSMSIINLRCVTICGPFFSLKWVETCEAASASRHRA